MCRLFGLVANNKINAEFSFFKADLPFKELGNKNPDGLGIGYYKDSIAKIFKEPISTIESNQFDQKTQDIYSKILISHVRKASHGINKTENTHPFKYNNWLFAHNGSIDIRANLLERLHPKFEKLIKGETDSEVFFYWLMQNIEEQNNLIDGIKEGISYIQLNRGNKTTSLNFILINGKELIALRKAFLKIEKYSLYYLNRKPDKIKHIKFQSKETAQFIESKNLRGEEAVLVCSEPLTEEEKWLEISNSQLIMIDRKLNLKQWKI